MTAATLTAASAAEQLLAEVRLLLARHDRTEDLDQLTALADELGAIQRRVRSQIRALRKREEEQQPAPVQPTSVTRAPVAEKHRVAEQPPAPNQPARGDAMTYPHPQNQPQWTPQWTPPGPAQQQPYYPAAPGWYPPAQPVMRDGYGIASIILAVIAAGLGLGRLALMFPNLGFGVIMLIGSFVAAVAAVGLGAYGRTLWVRRQASSQTPASWGMGIGMLVLILVVMSLIPMPA